jgi:cellulose synthase/poly-beta-1,6-N-acetylglucosamine synthase-like glycosyltransferase
MNFEIVMFLICTAVLSMTLFNFLLLRRVRNEPHPIATSVAVLLPLRNETENIFPLITSLQEQTGLADVKFYCLDDQSSDDTFDKLIAATKGDARFSLHCGEILPEGWIGKPFALQQVFEISTSEIVVVIDADVRLTAHAISSGIFALRSNKLDYLSAYPRQIAESWPERLIQPLLQWSWLATVPLRLAEKLGNSSFAVANGQFFLVRREALMNVGGFRNISDRVLDDISLARLLLKSGFRGTVSDASQVASCRMYNSWSQIKYGYGKSLKTAFKSPVGFILTVLFLLFSGPVPLLFALSGSVLGLVSLGAIILSRAVSAASSGGKKRDSIWQPISTSLLVYLIGYSLIKRKSIYWKGRPV